MIHTHNGSNRQEDKKFPNFKLASCRRRWHKGLYSFPGPLCVNMIRLLLCDIHTRRLDQVWDKVPTAPPTPPPPPSDLVRAYIFTYFYLLMTHS